MIDEEERREYLAILGSLYKVLQERKQAHTSQGDVSDTADGPSNEESTDLPRLVRASSPGMLLAPRKETSENVPALSSATPTTARKHRDIDATSANHVAQPLNGIAI
ncbi:uncharacterized protein LOC142774743 [Rhipicephalus microplus]|uniref:uncharacterized protein LOC142774743 n=1 Tax=Rhipicephalus microplus TaxID=6941 RepID=UPI003F6D9670